MAVPTGTPSTVPTVSPPSTIASARPRRAGSTSAVAAAEAFGVYRAAPRPAATRGASSSARVGAAAEARLASTNKPSAASISGLRGSAPVIPASSGAVRA